MRRSSRWVMWLVILGVGGVFVMYLGIGGGFSRSKEPTTVVGVGRRHFDSRDVYRIRLRQEEEYRRALGSGFDPKAASDFLDQNAAGTLLRSALLAVQAERLGLRASDQEVRSYLRRLAGAQNGGRIDEEAVTAFAERDYGSLKRFEQALRDDLLAQKADRLIAGSAGVSDGEVRDALRYARETVRIAYLKLAGEKAAEAAEIDPAQVQKLLKEQPERVRRAYEARKSEFDRPDQVHARHILFRVDAEAGEEAEATARARAEAALARLKEGASFEDLALELSEDPGSKENGGDLGTFPRGRMVKAFEDVAFSLEPGTLSDIVRSPYGFHLIRVEEHLPAASVPFEEAQEQIAREFVAQDAGLARARALAEEIAQAVREGGSLIEVARERGLSLERPEPIRRRPDGYVPGLGAAREVMTAAFSLSMEHPSDPRIHEVENGFVLIQLLEHHTPSEAELASAMEEERKRLRSERRAAVEKAWIEALRDELASSGELVYDLAPLQRGS